MNFELPKLNFGYKDLEPYIDEETVRIHYLKHHQGYLNKLIDTIESFDHLKEKTPEELMVGFKDLPEDIRQKVVNFAGGVINHDLYWESLQPYDEHSGPEGKLLSAIEEVYGDLDGFFEKFEEKAMGVFGSGWAFLVVNKDGKLEMTRQSFQNSPLMYGQTPILTVDVWEHAYYLKYQNKRADYVKAFMKLINWQVVEKKYLLAVK
ncbi:superoxide dismutase [Candidatus Woesebacteria bacterium]|nr:superoxide dismutase [Candidatus Woesebacteria bacterium]